MSKNDLLVIFFITSCLPLVNANLRSSPLSNLTDDDYSQNTERIAIKLEHGSYLCTTH